MTTITEEIKEKIKIKKGYGNESYVKNYPRK